MAYEHDLFHTYKFTALQEEGFPEYQTSLKETGIKREGQESLHSILHNITLARSIKDYPNGITETFLGLKDYLPTCTAWRYGDRKFTLISTCSNSKYQDSIGGILRICPEYGRAFRTES